MVTFLCDTLVSRWSWIGKIPFCATSLVREHHWLFGTHMQPLLESAWSEFHVRVFERTLSIETLKSITQSIIIYILTPLVLLRTWRRNVYFKPITIMFHLGRRTYKLVLLIVLLLTNTRTILGKEASTTT